MVAQGGRGEAALAVPELLLKLLWTLCWLLPVYMAGTLGLSPAVLVMGVALWLGWRLRRRDKTCRLHRALYLLDNEELVTRNQTQHSLPAWISFPDLERAEWLNKVLLQAWPFVGQFLEKLLLNSIAPAVRESNNHLQTFSFTKVSFGVKPLKIHGVKTHTDSNKNQVTIDLHISYIGDCEINVEVKKYFCKAGVNGIQLHGMLRVILEPLIGDMPLVGAVTLFFIQRPVLEINWTGLTNLLDIPGLSSKTDTMLMDTIASFLVLPNRITCPLMSDLRAAELRSPLPRGIVRIFLVEAVSLESKDTYVKGIIKGRSDPYAIVRVGTQTFMSKTISESINPKWNEMYEVMVHEVPGQLLEIEIFDKDPDQDDFLGRMKLDLGEVMKGRILDEWFTLKDVERGKVHLRLEWLSLRSEAATLEQALLVNSSISTKDNEEPSAAVMVVYVDQAQDLPLKHGTREPNALVQVSLLDKTFETRAIYNTVAPVWEDAFTFFVQNPQQQDLDIQVKDDDRQQGLGSLTLPLARLLTCPDLTLEQWCQLENAGQSSRIFLKIVMRILTRDGVDVSNLPRSRKSTLERLSSAKGGGEVSRTTSVLVEAVGMGGLVSAPLPPHSAAPSSVGTEGVIRIQLIEAENLIAKDNFMGGMVKGKSDPYIKIRAGPQSFRSKTIKENLNPKWNELYEVIANHIPGQELEFEVFDKDIDKDDFLGRLKISYKDIINSKDLNEWYMLNDVKSGKLHLKLEWLPPTPDCTKLEQVLRANSVLIAQEGVEPSAAILTVYLDRAHGLPVKKAKKLPNPNVELTLNNTTYKSKVVSSTDEPFWDEHFSFLVTNPNTEALDIQVRDGGQCLGRVSVPLSRLLAIPGLTSDTWFPLEDSGPDSQLLMKVMLGILESEHSRQLYTVQSEAICSGGPRDGDCATSPPLTHDPSAFPGEGDSVGNVTGSAEQELRHRGGRVQSKADVSDSPQIRLTLHYNHQQTKLVLVVHACRNLRVGSKDTPDPYVSLILQPDKTRVTKRKTSVKKKSTSPEYNDRFDFDLTWEEMQKRTLDLSVKNSISFMSREKELLGRLHVSLALIDLTQDITQWFDLKEE
eukprot:gi/632983699/ref/XP_007908775.1/ PREDICTED: extended synaptotagmin-1 [Callorhinchus milii]